MPDIKTPADSATPAAPVEREPSAPAPKKAPANQVRARKKSSGSRKGPVALAASLVLVFVLLLISLGLRQGKEEAQPVVPAQELTLPDSGRHLTVLQDGELVDMELNEYLWGVVAAEMPASFEQEALKAQAVAARTYALNKAGHAANHPEADLCTDYTCCQAWIARDTALSNWGENAAAYADKITRAVAETNNEVILYEGSLISALFHSSSGEGTQDAEAVWGNSVPYLQSVPSPEGEEVPNYHSEVILTAQACREAILAACPEAVLEGEPTNWFGPVTPDTGGSVGTIVLGGVTVSGAQARQIFGLRSANFTVEPTAEAVTFQVTGFGHGVGMSQYGANAMAADGSSYLDILQHYYTGVTVDPCPG